MEAGTSKVKGQGDELPIRTKNKADDHEEIGVGVSGQTTICRNDSQVIVS
jgi:hypothetical protein